MNPLRLLLCPIVPRNTTGYILRLRFPPRCPPVPYVCRSVSSHCRPSRSLLSTVRSCPIDGAVCSRICADCFPIVPCQFPSMTAIGRNLASSPFLAPLNYVAFSRSQAVLLQFLHAMNAGIRQFLHLRMTFFSGHYPLHDLNSVFYSMICFFVHYYHQGGLDGLDEVR